MPHSRLPIMHRYSLMWLRWTEPGWLRSQNAAAGNYDEYFGMATDVEAVVYLMLQNQMLHDLFPTVVTIGEDVSGMPTFCR